MSFRAGEYTIYYFGGNELPVIVDLPNADPADFTVDSSKAAYDFAEIGSKTHHMKEITLTLSADYSGDVTFYNDNGWLPTSIRSL